MNALPTPADVPTGADSRRVNRLVQRAVALEMLRSGRGDLRQLDTVLAPVDRIMQRWAVSIGQGLPSEEWDDSSRSRPPALDDATAVVVDQIVLKTPMGPQRLIRAWYKTPQSSKVIADSLKLSVGGLYLEWRAALTYLRIKFRESHHADLLRMVLLGI